MVAPPLSPLPDLSLKHHDKANHPEIAVGLQSPHRPLTSGAMSALVRHRFMALGITNCHSNRGTLVVLCSPSGRRRVRTRLYPHHFPVQQWSPRAIFRAHEDYIGRIEMRRVKPVSGIRRQEELDDFVILVRTFAGGNHIARYTNL